MANEELVTQIDRVDSDEGRRTRGFAAKATRGRRYPTGIAACANQPTFIERAHGQIRSGQLTNRYGDLAKEYAYLAAIYS